MGVFDGLFSWQVNEPLTHLDRGTYNRLVAQNTLRACRGKGPSLIIYDNYKEAVVDISKCLKDM